MLVAATADGATRPACRASVGAVPSQWPRDETMSRTCGPSSPRLQDPANVDSRKYIDKTAKTIFFFDSVGPGLLTVA